MSGEGCQRSAASPGRSRTPSSPNNDPHVETINRNDGFRLFLSFLEKEREEEKKTSGHHGRPWRNMFSLCESELPTLFTGPPTLFLSLFFSILLELTAPAFASGIDGERKRKHIDPEGRRGAVTK